MVYIESKIPAFTATHNKLQNCDFIITKQT